MKTQIVVQSGQYSVYCPMIDNDRVRNAPTRKFSKTLGWRLPFTLSNSKYLLKAYRLTEFSDEAYEKACLVVSEATKPEILLPVPAKLMDGSRPHQKRAVEKAWYKREFAFLHRMRTGKTMTTIRLGQGRYQQELIDVMLVFCPMSIKDVWRRQLVQWCQIEYSFYDAETGSLDAVERWWKKVKPGEFPVISVAIESMSVGSICETLKEFFADKRFMAVVDESTRIKNSSAARTAKITEISLPAEFRLILTGSEVTRSPIDLYAQYMFLNEEILGHSSVYTFKNRYCIMGGFEKKKVIAYVNIPELIDKITPYSDLVETKDVADLPPKDYQIRSVKPSAEQTRLILELRKEMITSLEDNILEVNGALAYLTRAHQINGGMFPYKEADKWYSRPLDDNPKIDELFNVIEECSGKIVVWCRYRGEIAQVVARLAKEYGEESICQYHGGFDATSRALQEKAFAENPSKKFMVANQQTGAMGVDFSEAELMVYFSNTFNFEDRQQSEERATSIAKKNKVFIVDIILNNATDRGIMKNLSDKKDIAEYISDNIKNAASLI